MGRCLSLESILAERAALGPTESWLERETLRVLGRAGLPLPEVQCTLRQRGAFVSRVDLLYRAARIVIEVEGKSHDPDEQRGVDARQRNGVQLLGHAVLTYTYQQVVSAPHVMLAEVSQLLAERSGTNSRQASGF